MVDLTLEFKPSHDERARQSYVGAIKGYTNMVVQPVLEQRIEDEFLSGQQSIQPQASISQLDIVEECKRLPLFAFWSNLTFHSQDMLFRTVGDTVARTKQDQEGVAKELTSNPSKVGSLILNRDLKVSPPISTVEIHRMPGGYVTETDENDLTAARLYSGTIEIYRNAKAMGDGSTAGSDAIGQFTAQTVKSYFPELNPKRVLDLGCGTGEQTVAFKKAFPNAEVHGLDTAGPLLRFAHAWAECQKMSVHFQQVNAQATDYPDDHFDLIVSHILFHETSRIIMPKIMKEAYRILAPGGVFLNLDVPYQPDITPVPRRITNHWQVINNGEPFWTGFAETKLPPLFEAAGFLPAKTFHNYETFGAGKYLVFGGQK